jgi:hypothetical protein
LRRDRNQTLCISALVALAGCNATGVLVHLTPADGTMPQVDIVIARPDGTQPNSPYRAQHLLDGRKQDVLIHIPEEDISEIAVQFQVQLAGEIYCQQSRVKLVRGGTVELSVTPEACALTLAAGCVNCSAPEPCLNASGVASCSELRCKAAASCTSQSYCDGCGQTVTYCCPSGTTCSRIDSVSGIGSACQ